MKYWRPEFNFAWYTVKDTNVKRIMISPFHDFIIELQNGERINALKLKTDTYVYDDNFGEL